MVLVLMSLGLVLVLIRLAGEDNRIILWCVCAHYCIAVIRKGQEGGREGQ